MLLEIKNVKKKYHLGNGQPFEALKGVSVSFDKGELVSIIGESGSGKSTLMNVIGGLDLEFEGDVIIEGNELKKYKEKELDQYRKNRIGFVFQSFHLIPHLSVLDNVTIAMTLSNISKKERNNRAKKILTEVGLESQINKKPNQLSGGQMQRVAIARALINDPDIILADEPTGSLDSKTSSQILELIKRVASSGKLVIMVTHSEKVAAISNRILTISDGMIVHDEKKRITSPKEIQSENIRKERQNLSFLSSIKLAFQNMKEKKTRNILVSIGSSIGIMSVVLMLSLGNGVVSYVNDIMKGYVNPLVIEVNKKQEDSKNNSNNYFFESIPFQQEEINQISSISGVVRVEKAYNYYSFNNANKISMGENQLPIQMMHTISSNITSENIKKGRLPNKNEMMVDGGISNYFGNDILGKTLHVELLINNTSVISDFVVSGIYGSSTSDVESNNYQIFLNYNDLDEITSQQGVDLKPTTIYVVASNKEDAATMKDSIMNMGYAGSMQEKMLQLFNDLLNVITYVLTAISGISLLVSSIMILVVLYISVVERTKEIGILKAIGARRKDIKRIFAAEAFLLGLFGGLIGILSEFILGFFINQLVENMYGIYVVKTTIMYVLLGLSLSIVISMIAGIYPSGKAAKLDPVESLRRE